jgi:predicted RNase H-like HicB family nuclease
MHVLILIEPIEGERFRAKAGEPFGVSAEGKTVEEAAQHLKTILRDRLQTGGRLALLDLGNGLPLPTSATLHQEPLPDNDWFFQTMRETIAENRQRENEESRAFAD